MVAQDTELEVLARMILDEHASVRVPGGCQCRYCRLCRMVLAPIEGRNEIPQVKVSSGSSIAVGIATERVEPGDLVRVWIHPQAIER